MTQLPSTIPTIQHPHTEPRLIGSKHIAKSPVITGYGPQQGSTGCRLSGGYRRAWPSGLLQLILLVLTLTLAYGCASTKRQTQTAASGKFPNLVAVSPWIDTSGQPSAAQLAALNKEDYRVVINLSPSHIQGSEPEEERIVTSKGISYVHIPVDTESLDLVEFELFSAILNQSRGRKVLVHCQSNIRASTFVFLYRVIEEGVGADEAYDSVTQIWIPDDVWPAFIARTLEHYGIVFQP